MAHFRTEISGSVVVVLGASSGLGRGAALKLAAAGASVVLAARRDDLLSKMETDITSADGEALAVHCDVSAAHEVDAVAEAALQRYGRIDVWINNVGVGALGFFWSCSV